MDAFKAWLDGWVLQPQYLPGWLSAFAALIVSGISVWAVLRTGAAERRRGRLQSRAIAVAIYPGVAYLETVVDETRKELATLKAHSGVLARQNVASEVQRVAQIPIPTMLVRNVDRLFKLGEVAGLTCLHVVTVLLRHNEAVELAGSRMLTVDATRWAGQPRAAGAGGRQEHP
jgi:hypothetical protein